MKTIKAFFFLATLLYILGCSRNESGSPIAKILVSSNYADTITILSFDASTSSDPQDPVYTLSFRWDWNSDQVWDTKFSQLSQNAHKYRDLGIYEVTLEVQDQDGLTDTASVFVRIEDIRKDSAIIDSRDNTQYRVVLVKDMWWMAENLNIGVKINDDQFPADNGIIEKYYLHNSDSLGARFGGLYTWYEVFNYKHKQEAQDICPPGWRLPTWQEIYFIDLLINYPNSNHANLIGKNGIIGLDFERSGYFNLRGDGLFYNSYGVFWLQDSLTHGPSWNGTIPYPGSFNYYNGLSIGFSEPEINNYRTAAFHLRCVKEAQK